MLEYTIDERYTFSLFVSDEMYSERRSRTNPNFRPNSVIRHIYELLIIYDEKNLLRNLRKNHQHNRVAILNAHGCVDEGQWKYVDQDKRYPLQEFIDEKDEEGFLAIIVSSCNYGRHNLVSKKTPIIYPLGELHLESEYEIKIFTP